MTTYFNRVYKLEIGSDSDTIVYDGLASNAQQTPAQIEFTVDQTPNAWRSLSEITIYGVARERRNAIYEQYSAVRLTAGYADGFGVIFNGEIENVEIGRSEADSFVKLFCQSSAAKWPTAYVNQSFSKGTPMLNVIRAVAATFGKPVEIVGDFSTLPRAINGLTLSRDSKQALDEMAHNFDFAWMEENGKLVVYKDGADRTDSDIFEYSAVTGLVGSPSITTKGIDIEVLLNPFIRPRDRFEVKATTGKLVFNGVYYSDLATISTGKGVHQVLSLVHEGNFYGDMWRTKIEGVRPFVV